MIPSTTRSRKFILHTTTPEPCSSHPALHPATDRAKILKPPDLVTPIQLTIFQQFVQSTTPLTSFQVEVDAFDVVYRLTGGRSALTIDRPAYA